MRKVIPIAKLNLKTLKSNLYVDIKNNIFILKNQIKNINWKNVFRNYLLLDYTYVRYYIIVSCYILTFFRSKTNF